MAAACAGLQKPDGSTGPARQAKVDPLDRSNYEDQWQAFHRDAVAHYAFSEAQAASADAVLQSCLARAADRRGQFQKDIQQAKQTKEAGAEEKAHKQLKTALDKLADECLGRIEGIASLDQVAKADAGGFESPSKRKPRMLPEVGFLAPLFELKESDGKPVSLESLRGKVVVLHFWATWCGYCKKSMPEMGKFCESVKDKPDVLVFGVNCKQRPTNPDPVTFAKEQGCGYTVLLNGDDVASAYQVQGYPTLYVVGRDGKIIHKERGAQADVPTRLAPIIARALAQPAPAKGA
jgi:thiol-disulfide isomerase/thioredoxin